MMFYLGLQWLIVGTTFASMAGDFPPNFHDIDLELSSREYGVLLKGMPEDSSSRALRQVLQVGTRNLEWLKHMNSFLPGGQKISITSAATQPAFPIDAPSRMNETIILTTFETRVNALPPQMKSVLIDQAPFTQTPPLALKTYIDHAFLIDRSYQAAARWIYMQPRLAALAQQKKRDIRGYYFLKNRNDRDSLLSGYSNLAPGLKDEVKLALLGMCLNGLTNESSCREELDSGIRFGTLKELYSRFLGKSSQIYQEYFDIPEWARRRDIEWTQKEPHRMIFPFLDPNHSILQSFLQSNIEDEWKVSGWNLLLSFRKNAAARVEFEAGTVPHVNRIGGDVITMDENSSLDDYGVQWLIRHEFGHVIGFPDCYIEFYDSAVGEIISYQIDTTNLMCSRRGHLLPEHLTQLQRAYLNR